MDVRTLSTALAAGCFLGPTAAFAVTSTVVSTDATALANALLGDGVTISSATLTGAEGQAGTFSGGEGSIGIDEGVILSSGFVDDAVGPNTDSGITGVPGVPGDSDLDAIVSPLFTNDAVRLDIEFESDTGDIFFDYVFASDEYNEFVDAGVNDAFALLLDGTNLALIPGTSDPVTIDTVNLGDNAGLFNDNESGAFNVEYDGFTDVFTASFEGLAEGSHLLSFIVADVGDSILDSAVFIKAGSLASSEDPLPPPPQTDVIPLPASAWLMLAGLGALGGMARRRRKD